MKLKRLLSLLLAALMLFSTVACGSKEAVDTTAAKTEAVTEEKMPETPNEDFVVVIDKENSGAVDAAERMVWQMKTKYGIDLEVIDHKEKAYVKEIVLGKTNRGENIDISGMILDEYEIKTVGEKVFIDGASDDGLYGGAVKLLNTCTDENGFNIAKDYAYKDTSGYPIEKLTINGNDISKYTILYPENASEKTMTGVSELQKYIERSCGAKLEAKVGSDGDFAIILEEKTIVVEGSANDNIDNFSLKSEGNNIRITGSAERGLLYGCYDLIDDVIGWVYMVDNGDSGNVLSHVSSEYLSPRDELDISGLDYTESSIIADRACVNSDRERHTALKWIRRCHTFDELDNAPDGTSYSEQYDNQPCLTDETVYQVMLANVLKLLDETPDAEIISISQNDNANYCKCENCAASDAKYGGPSGTLIAFLNKMADDMDKAGYGDILIHTFSYMYTEKAPENIKADSSIMIEFAPINSGFGHAIDGGCNNPNYGSQMKKWAEVCDQIYYWDYLFCYSQHPAPFPYIKYDNLAANFRFIADMNTVGYYPNARYSFDWEFGALRLYLTTQLAWNPYMSEDEYNGYIKKFMEGYFGAGWEDIYEAFCLWTDNATGCNGFQYGTGYFSDNQIFMVAMKLRNVIDDILDDFYNAMYLAETKEQFNHIDCNLIQFEFVYVNGVFDKLYKSEDPADNQLAQDISHTLQDRMQRHKVRLGGNFNYIPDFDSFTVRPEFWRMVEKSDFKGYNLNGEYYKSETTE